MRKNGSVVGPRQPPDIYMPSGVWDLEDVHDRLQYYIDVLRVGSGGGGGSAPAVGGGGGGGGDVLETTAVLVKKGESFTVTVGAGGAVDAAGNSSSFGVLPAATGGGRGATGSGVAGGNGANGGGGTTGAGAGGSGVVVVRYRGVQRATGGTVTSVDGWTIHTFTSSGTFAA